MIIDVPIWGTIQCITGWCAVQAKMKNPPVKKRAPAKASGKRCSGICTSCRCRITKRWAENPSRLPSAIPAKERPRMFLVRVKAYGSNTSGRDSRNRYSTPQANAIHILSTNAIGYVARKWSGRRADLISFGFKVSLFVTCAEALTAFLSSSLSTLGKVSCRKNKMTITAEGTASRSWVQKIHLHDVDPPVQVKMIRPTGVPSREESVKSGIGSSRSYFSHKSDKVPPTIVEPTEPAAPQTNRAVSIVWMFSAKAIGKKNKKKVYETK